LKKLSARSKPPGGAAPVVAFPAKAGRPAAHEGPRRLERILDVAMQEFTAHGFGGANIERIARTAGVGKATIYRNFGEKPGLFEALVRRTLTRIGDIWRNVTFDLDDPTGTLRAVALVSYEQWSSESLALYRVIYAEATRLPDLAQTVHDITYRISLRPLIDYLQALKDRGVLEIADTQEAAANFTQMAVGGTRFLLFPATLDAEQRGRLADEAVRMFLHGTLATGAAPGRPRGPAPD